MNRPFKKDLIAAIVLIALGVFARVAFQHIPNFAPVAALALFAGYLFANRILAVCVPLAVMLISDNLVEAGGYQWQLMLTVYGLLALPVAFHGPIRKYLSLENSTGKSIIASVVGLMGCSLACSLVFFLGTNAMVWMTGTWYEPTLGGLFRCFTAAIPFFRYTLTGDAIFATTLFGSYAAYKVAIASINARPAYNTASN